MFDLLQSAYPWIKAAHVVAMVAWMAGLFYLPRLFVYHAERGTPGSELDATFQVMERRLLRAIINPSMIATWVLGVTLVLLGGSFADRGLWRGPSPHRGAAARCRPRPMGTAQTPCR